MRSSLLIATIVASTSVSASYIPLTTNTTTTTSLTPPSYPIYTPSSIPPVSLPSPISVSTPSPISTPSVPSPVYPIYTPSTSPSTSSAYYPTGTGGASWKPSGTGSGGKPTYTPPPFTGGAAMPTAAVGMGKALGAIVAGGVIMML